MSPFRVETFEFPVLAKYRFGVGKLRLFAEAGPSFRAAGNLNFYPSHYGASAGVGVEMPWRRLNIALALRYTRWAPDTSPLRSVSQLNPRFRFGKMNPFAETGPSFRLPVVGLSDKGTTAGIGVEMRWRALHIAPGLRFTRWSAGTSPATSPESGDFTRDEAAVLLALSVGGPTSAAR